MYQYDVNSRPQFVSYPVPSDGAARVAWPRRDDFRKQEGPVTLIGTCDGKMIDIIMKERFEEGK
jgi:hypothetical protein